MKLVVFSDLHIHKHRFGATVDAISGRHSRLQDCLDILHLTAAVAEGFEAAVRVFCGDLFHVRGHLRPSELNPTIEHFRAVHEPHGRMDGIMDLMIPGNHDMEHRADGEHALTALKAIDGVRVFEGFGYEVVPTNAGDLGVGWVQYAPDVGELKKRVAAVAAQRRTYAGTAPRYAICLIHHGVDGAMPGIPDMGFNPTHLPTDDFDVVLCGDYHNHKELVPGKAWMVGAPLQHTFGDAGQKRGYMVFDLDAKRFSHIESAAPKFVCWDQGAPTPPDVAGNFIRIRATDEKILDNMVKVVEGLKPAALQKELVRDFTAIARSDVKLTMTTGQMFKTWLDDQQKDGRLPPTIDTTALVALNDECLRAAQVS